MVRFIHITKTGGSSVLETCGNKIFVPKSKEVIHVPYKEEDLERITFSIVRNPYNRVESLYNFYKYKRPVVDKNHTFRDFVMLYDSYYNNPPNHPIMTFKTCFDYTSWKGEMKTTHILKFENLNDEWEKFANEYNLPKKLKHVNTNNLKEKNLEWDDDMKNNIQRIYKMDFVSFNYDM